MKKHTFTVFIIIVCLALTGCASTNLPLAPTLTPAQKSILPTLAAVPTASTLLIQTPTREIQVNETCPASIDNNASAMAIDGKLILSSAAVSENPYLLDVVTESKTTLPYAESYYVDELKISPDRQWMAYFAVPKNNNTTDNQLIIANVNGDIVYQRNVNRMKEWYAIDTWLDNQTLMLERYRTLPNSTFLATPLPVTLLNPFTGSATDLDFSFPDLVYLAPKVMWDSFGYSATAYNPALNLVAYAKVSPDARETIVLWSLQSNKEIAGIQAAIGFGSGPVWSPDGSQFIVDSLAKIPEPRNWTEEERLSEELFSVDQTGNVTRLTHLTEYFKEVSINGYAWSPDGGRIAFDVLAKHDSNSILSSRLAILDTQTKQVTIYCLHPYAEATGLFWSPNGQQLLLGVASAEKSGETNGATTYNAVLLDINQNLIINIADETIPLGWVVEKP